VTTSPVQWDEIDTVLLDMDGTLLDLNYDNVLWNHHLPERFATRHGLTPSAAKTRLDRHFEATRHTIEHYCLDYWSRFTQLDMIELHRELMHLIRYRPHAETFLARLKITGRRAVLVTNAHRGSLDVKDEITALTARLDHAVSSHDFRAPKESQTFWRRLSERIGFEPSRTLLIDDNAAVLRAASQFGIGRMLTVSQPDSSRPAREKLEYPAFNTFDEIVP
jgi:putative hydrolase of the HAD superfamily